MSKLTDAVRKAAQAVADKHEAEKQTVTTTTPAKTTTVPVYTVPRHSGSPLANQKTDFYGVPVGISNAVTPPAAPTKVVPESVIVAANTSNVGGTATLQQLTGTTPPSIPTAPVATTPIISTIPTFQQYDNAMPVSEFEKYLLNKQSESLVRTQEQIRDIDPTAMYTTPMGRLPLPGSFFIKNIQRNEQKYQSQLQAELNAVSGFAPGTTVRSTVRGFEYNFPYAGAEKYTYYKKLLEENPGQAAALGWGWGGLGNVDIAYYKATGQNEKAIQRQIEQLAGYAGAKTALASGDIGGFSKSYWSGWLSSPATQIGFAYAGGEAFGAIQGAGVGYLVGRNLPILAKAFNVGLFATGGAMMAPTVVDIGTQFYKGDVGAGLGKSTLFTAELTAGLKGFNAGKPSGYQYGAEKGFNKYLSTEYKAGNIDATIYNSARNVLKSGKFLSKKGFDFIQKPMEGFSDVQSVKSELALRRYLWKKISTTKSELFGGTVGEKPGGTHDIDVFMKPRTKVYSAHASETLAGKDIANFADVKMPQKPGDIVTEFGAVKQKPSIVEVGGKEFKTQKGLEQFTRKWQSSLRPAHSGRLKDMPEAVRLSNKLFEGKEITPEIETNLAKFKTGLDTLYGYGEKNPLISSAARTKSIYGSGLSEKWYNVKVKFWEKVTLKSDLNADLDLAYNKPMEGYNPPSPSSSFGSPIIGGLSGLSSASISESFSPSPSISRSYSPSISPSPSISKSFSVSPSISKSFSPSPSISRSYSPSISPSQSISKSFSVSPSISKSFSPYISSSKSKSPSLSPSPSPSPSRTLFPFGGGGLESKASGTGRFKRRMRSKSKVWDLPIPKLSDLFGG